MPAGDAAPSSQNVPARHGFACALALPAAVQKPAAHAPEHALVERPGVAPNVPAAHGVGAPAPASQKDPTGHCTWFLTAEKAGQKKPASHLFVRSAALPAARHEPSVHGEHAAAVAELAKVPTGHGVAAREPGGQKWPAPQSAPVVAPAAAQTLPAAHAFDVAVELPVAVQKPAAHATHAAADVATAPPADHVPAAHAFVVPAACPSPHQKPAGHGACVMLAIVADGQ